MRAAGLLLLSCVLLAGASAAQPAAPDGPTRIYGIEVERSPQRDRLLVFADGLLRPQLEEVDPGTVMLSFPGARLDPSAPARIDPEAGGAILSVSVFETADDPQEVRITVVRTARTSPSLSQRGSQVAVDFRRPGRVTRVAPGVAEQRTLDARWLDMKAVEAIEKLARFLGWRVIIDPGVVSGTVSIDAPQPIPVGEAAALLESLLLLKGLAAIEGPGDALKVVPLAAHSGPWVESLEGQPAGAVLVTLLRLEEVDAEVAVQALQPLAGKQTLMQVYAPSNAVLLAGAHPRLARIAKVLRELDRESATRVVLIPLRHADAERTRDALEEAFGEEPAFRAWPDVRTQRVIVRARHRVLERVRDLVARVDRPAEGSGTIQVIPVQYSDPERIATMLRDLAVESNESEVQVRGAESLAGRTVGVSVHGPSHSLVVQADASTISVIRGLVAEIDRPPRRVEVEVGVTEVLYSNGLVLAFDAIVPLIEPKDARDLVAAAVFNPSVVYGASGTPLPSQIEQTLRTRPNSSFFGRIARSPIVVQVLDPRVPGQTIEVEIPRETALVTADAQEINTRILLRPRLTLISGEEHEIFAGENLPVPNSASDAGSDPTPTGNPLRTSATIERRDVGVSLRVKPTVPEEGPIALEVSIEVSTLSGGRPGGPTFLERTLEARVYLESGRTAVIGTAEGPVTSDVRVGVPFLMDIPILGWLFRTEQRVERKASLLITLSAVRQHPEADELTQWMLDRLGEEPEDLAVVAP